MTLRDIAIRLDELRATFAGDLEMVARASPLDWPLYMLAVAAVAAVTGFIFFAYAMCYLGEAWEKFRPAEKNPSSEPGPVSNFIFLAGVFFVAWLFAFGTTAALMHAVTAGMVGSWISVAFATIAVSFLIYLIRLGRRTIAQEKLNRKPHQR